MTCEYTSSVWNVSITANIRLEFCVPGEKEVARKLLHNFFASNVEQFMFLHKNSHVISYFGKFMKKNVLDDAKSKSSKTINKLQQEFEKRSIEVAVYKNTEFCVDENSMQMIADNFDKIKNFIADTTPTYVYDY